MTGKVIPNPKLMGDEVATKGLNLTVLQRIDPFVEDILITAAHVTLYMFNLDLNQWSRKDVEGSLFVVKRNTQPRFQFIVMNRRNTENLVEDLLGDFEYEVQVPYLLYRNAAQEVNGIWFYNTHDCEAVANLFNRILNAYSKVPPKPKVSSNKSEFEELEAVPTSSVIEGPLEPPASTATSPPPPPPAVTDVPDDSFVNFFTQAVSIGTAPSIQMAQQPQLQSAAVPANTIPIPPALINPHAPGVTPVVCPPSLPPPAAVPQLQPSTTPPLTPFENHISNLVKPSLFAAPSSSSLFTIPSSTSAPTGTNIPTAAPAALSSVPTAPPLLPPVSMQRPYGAPLLQPFPPPNPSPSLAPAGPTYGPVISRDRVREALTRLVLNDQFVDMVYREILTAHNNS